MKRLLAAIAICSGILIQPAGAVAAAIISSHGGLILSPAIVELSGATGQKDMTFAVTVTNDSPNKVAVITKVDDFTSLNDTGSVQFLNNTNRAASDHGLAHWMTPSVPAFDLEAHASRTITVTVDGLSVMAPGGHYGAVIFGVAPSTSSPQSNAVGATAAVSSLVFLATDNPGTESVSLLKPDIGFMQFALPRSVDLVFANAGNVQATPRGLVIVSDPFGHVVARGMVNIESGQVLPGTSRLYQIMLSPSSALRLPGLYRLTVAYHADGQAKPSKYEQTFLYVPSVVLVAGAALLVVGLVLLLRRFTPAGFYRLQR